MVAGVLAALTGLCYAELAARFPEAAGAPAYVKEAFGSDRLSQLTGLTVAVVLVLSTASIARGSAGYVQAFLALPAPLIGGAAVAIGTAVACLGVRDSVGLAALMTLVELGGLALVVATGAGAAADAWARWPDLLLPDEAAGWSGIVGGAFLAFFAFIGFENMANIAEEAKRAERTLPRAIVISLVLSTAIYVLVTGVAVLAIPHAALVESAAPLMLVVAGASWFSAELFAAIALVAIGNGALLELITLSRLLYGMAHRAWLPAGLAAVHPRRHVPVRATLIAGALVGTLTVALPFASLVQLTSAMTLALFALVAAALWRLHRTAPRPHGFRCPRAVPPLAVLGSLALLASLFVAEG